MKIWCFFNDSLQTKQGMVLH